MFFFRIDSFILNLSLLSIVTSHAVNINNTWMLPEEGFLVFYRYFQDRISWFEADAVCQFHHANLVTADTSSQYDAIRAYLKELDITENVWLGLSRTAQESVFRWRNLAPLRGDGHWQQTVPLQNADICVSIDPNADFLWKPMTCGGPDTASFICEMEVPLWATGCLLTELPSLTALYVPEEVAIELISDCGLDGVKRITCQGNANREEMIKQLTCAISTEEISTSRTISELSSESLFPNGKSTKSWIFTSNTIEDDIPTRQRRETEDTVDFFYTKSTTDIVNDKTTSGTENTSDEFYNFSTTVLVPTEEIDIQEFQEQLFSELENGNVLDVVELNDSLSENTKIYDETTEETQTETQILTESTTGMSLTNATLKVAFEADETDKNLESNYTNHILQEKDNSLTEVLTRTFRKSPSIYKEPTPATDNLNAQETDKKNSLPNQLKTSQNVKKRIQIVETVLMKKSASQVAKTPDKNAQTTESFELVSEIQPRPNRQRTLTRQQHRSFYPYFFSRVIG